MAMAYCENNKTIRRADYFSQNLKPKDIVSRASFENAMVTVMALGGSTNAVLHLIAMAKAFDIELTIDDFQSVSLPRRHATTCT